MIRAIHRCVTPSRAVERLFGTPQRLHTLPVPSRLKLQPSRRPCDCSRLVPPATSAQLFELHPAILLLSPIQHQQLFLESPKPSPQSSEPKRQNFQHQLKLSAHRLQHSFPGLLSGHNDFSLYASNVTFEDRINGLTISGLGPLKVAKWGMDANMRQHGSHRSRLLINGNTC